MWLPVQGPPPPRSHTRRTHPDLVLQFFTFCRILTTHSRSWVFSDGAAAARSPVAEYSAESAESDAGLLSPKTVTRLREENAASSRYEPLSQAWASPPLAAAAAASFAAAPAPAAAKAPALQDVSNVQVRNPKAPPPSPSPSSSQFPSRCPCPCVPLSFSWVLLLVHASKIQLQCRSRLLTASRWNTDLERAAPNTAQDGVVSRTVTSFHCLSVCTPT